jgi:di/tripeptidase
MSAVLSVTRCATHTLENLLFVILQANIDMVKMERGVVVEEEDCINIKMEEVYMPSVCIIKTEYEVSVVFWCIVW